MDGKCRRYIRVNGKSENKKKTLEKKLSEIYQYDVDRRRHTHRSPTINFVLYQI